MSPIPTGIVPMLATPGEPFDSPDFFFEVKWDGIRAIAYRDGSAFWIETRGAKQALPRFPELAGIRTAIRSEAAVLDGEIVVFGDDGRPDFDIARARNAQTSPAAIAASSARHPALFVAFDCLAIDGTSIMSEPFATRRDALLKGVRQTERIAVTHGVLRTGRDYFRALSGLGLEGMVGKALSSPYRPGIRSKEWIKVRSVKEVDCVVGGFLPKEPGLLKSLLVGLYDGDGELRYLGHVGTGFDSREAPVIRKALERIRSTDCPFGHVPLDAAKGAVWVLPRLVCRVQCLALTPNGRLRHPVYKGMRTDKAPRECLLETEPVSKSGPPAKDHGA